MKLPIRIDKRVEIPPRVSGEAQKYPWAQLKVGDSFFVPVDGHKSVGSLQVSLTGTGPRHGIRITTRQVVEHGKRGVRVWRIK